MYIRFQTPRGDGLFQHARGLRLHERRSAQELLDWFNRNLPVPPAEVYSPPRGLRTATWFREEQAEYADRGRRLAELVTRHVARMRHVRTRRPGEIVFEDAWQCVVWCEAAPRRQSYPVQVVKPAWDRRDRATIRC